MFSTGKPRKPLRTEGIRSTMMAQSGGMMDPTAAREMLEADKRAAELRILGREAIKKGIQELVEQYGNITPGVYRLRDGIQDLLAAHNIKDNHILKVIRRNLEQLDSRIMPVHLDPTRRGGGGSGPTPAA